MTIRDKDCGRKNLTPLAPPFKKGRTPKAGGSIKRFVENNVASDLGYKVRGNDKNKIIRPYA
jgi:hypothetical protein